MSTIDTDDTETDAEPIDPPTPRPSYWQTAMDEGEMLIIEGYGKLWFLSMHNESSHARVFVFEVDAPIPIQDLMLVVGESIAIGPAKITREAGRWTPSNKLHVGVRAPLSVKLGKEFPR